MQSPLSSDRPTGSRLGARHEAWEVNLDRIELDLIRAERAVDDPTRTVVVSAWDEPDDYGPIPAALRARAEDIVARQQAVLRRLGEHLGVTAHRQAVIDDVQALSRPAGTHAVYVDVSA